MLQGSQVAANFSMLRVVAFSHALFSEVEIGSLGLQALLLLFGQPDGNAVTTSLPVVRSFGAIVTQWGNATAQLLLRFV